MVYYRQREAKFELGLKKFKSTSDNRIKISHSVIVSYLRFRLQGMHFCEMIHPKDTFLPLMRSTSTP
jgi:hypothetical protein